MQNICFIADVAVLPRWIRVSQAARLRRIDPSEFLAFARGRAAAADQGQAGRQVRELSKGMVTQLHLSIIMSIDAKLLVLDEPTLGLDIIFRKEFYAQSAERLLRRRTHDPDNDAPG